MPSHVLGDDDESAPIEEPLVECPMCHCRVPETKLGWHIGRKLCLDCLAAWFGDDDSEDEK